MNLMARLNRTDLYRFLDVDRSRRFPSASRSECPVAVLLQEATGSPWLVSALNCVPEVEGIKEFRPPRWAQEFIRNLDRKFSRRKSFSAEDALIVLAEVI